MTEAEVEAIRLRNLKSQFKTQDKVKIGCCNGLPYNSSKRCCCRRIPFDKEHKFCCAINVSYCLLFQIKSKQDFYFNFKLGMWIIPNLWSKQQTTLQRLSFIVWYVILFILLNLLNHLFEYEFSKRILGLVIQEYGYHGQAGQPLGPQRKLARGGK